MVNKHWVQKLARDPVKLALSPLLSWGPPPEPRPGFSIILGTPWMLRELLPVNLRFLMRTNRAELDRIYIVFDRVAQPGAQAFIESIRNEFSELPLEFAFHPALPGRIVQQVNRTKFYASMNWYLGLRACATPYAVLHDFDLYPCDPELFVKIVSTMKARDLRFSGVEYTHFDGLTDQDALIGTWELGVDVTWLRKTYRPTQCFHAIANINGRMVDVDAFSRIQSRTPERALAQDVSLKSFAHVRNLCSTYLRYTEGRPVAVAWRLHFLWYLRSLAGREGDLEQALRAMAQADSSRLSMDGHAIDFTEVHVTCANVLDHEVERMESTLFGGTRPQVAAYLSATRNFLEKYGDHSPL